MAASHINSALQYHDARYLCGVRGGSDRTMSTFCFINAASRYHASPVKQRAVHKDEKSGRPRPLYLESEPPPHGGWYAKKPTETIGEPTSLY